MASTIIRKAVKLQPCESIQFSGVVEAVSVFLILWDTSIIEYDMQAIFFNGKPKRQISTLQFIGSSHYYLDCKKKNKNTI